MKKAKKIVRIILCAVAAVIVIALAAIMILWGSEIRSILSIKKLNDANADHLDGSVYEMTVYGDFYFDDFLEQGGASKDSQLIGFITQSITKGLIPMQISESNIGCSSFTATTDDNGHRVFGRNYDFARTNTCIVHTRPGKGRHASVSTIDLQFIGINKDGDAEGIKDKVLMLAAPYVPLDGINDAGLACGIYMSYQGTGDGAVATDQNTDKPDLTSTTMLRLILDYADDVDEAIELVKKYDLHDSANSSFHYMIADASGDSAVLEWIAGTDDTDNDGVARELVITRCEGTYQTVTNYIVAEGYYEGQPDEDIKGLDRRMYLEEKLAASDGHVEDIQAGMDLLSDIGRRTWTNNGKSLTIHSVMYDLTDTTALWVGNEHFGEEEYTHSLKAGK